MANQLEISALPLGGLALISRLPWVDERGSFEKLFARDVLTDAGFDQPVAQINLSETRMKGAIRGLHFQKPPACEDKIVICLSGEVFDVAVDLRRNSPTLLRWHGETLTAGKKAAIFIPKGFAHGFQVLSDECRLLYIHSHAHAPDAEGGLHYADPKLKISWPLAPTVVSDRDKAWPYIGADFSGYEP
ncbi:MAG: dTDP-4-dehydrorhamnose 3,5-epimerase family protein [Rhodobacteraceae bacterium]|nr:dTDP-4-dehydrorhamnose 3,5-epimerase family protein [Paracoccaceae bacterium]